MSVSATRLIPAQDVVDAALRTSAADECVVIVAERSETNLRWAANSLTTNGQMASRAVTVVSIQAGADGTRAGVVTRPVASDDELTTLVHDSERAAAAARNDDVARLASARRDDDWDAAAAQTHRRVRHVRTCTGPGAPQRRRHCDELLFGRGARGHHDHLAP
jgi:hypothetical protein